MGKESKKEANVLNFYFGCSSYSIKAKNDSKIKKNPALQHQY